jgi:hypothetical protein
MTMVTISRIINKVSKANAARAPTMMSDKIIVGAGGTSQPGWHSLEHKQLDVRDRSQ